MWFDLIPYWSNGSYTAWRYVGSLSCWKTNDSLTKHKTDGMAYRCRMLWQPCWLSEPWILNKSQSDSPTKKTHNITSSSMLHGGNHTCGDHLFTKTWRLEPKISNSDQRTDFHWSNVHCSCFLAQTSLFFLLISFSSGFFAAIRPWSPDSRSLLWTVDVEMSVTWTLGIIYFGCNLSCC